MASKKMVFFSSSCSSKNACLEVSKSGSICAPAGTTCHSTNLSRSGLSLRENKVPDPGPQSVLAPHIFTLWPTARSFQPRAASHGYLLNINLLTNLLANTWNRPEGRKKRQRGNKKTPGIDKAQGTFNDTLRSKCRAKLQFSFEELAVVGGTEIFITIILLFKPQS